MLSCSVEPGLTRPRRVLDEVLKLMYTTSALRAISQRYGLAFCNPGIVLQEYVHLHIPSRR